MNGRNRSLLKRIAAALLMLFCIFRLTACVRGKNDGRINLSGITLSLAASSEFFDPSGEHILSYTLTTAVLKDDGDIIFAHSFTNHSDYRITRITCEFYYYTDAGDTMAHKRLDRLLNEDPIDPGTTYTYYSTNNFSGAVPYSMAAHITCADTELETPILPKPNPDSNLFNFFTDGRYDGLEAAFRISPPVELRFKRDNENEMIITDSKSIKAVYEAMQNIHVGGASNRSVTDSGVYYTFVMSDGSEYTVSFESDSLISYGGSVYEFTGGTELFSVELKEDAYSQSIGSGYEDGYVE